MLTRCCCRQHCLYERQGGEYYCNLRMERNGCEFINAAWHRVMSPASTPAPSPQESPCTCYLCLPRPSVRPDPHCCNGPDELSQVPHTPLPHRNLTKGRIMPRGFELGSRFSVFILVVSWFLLNHNDHNSHTLINNNVVLLFGAPDFGRLWEITCCWTCCNALTAVPLNNSVTKNNTTAWFSKRLSSNVKYVWSVG